MKLILSIVQDDDGNKAISSLNDAGFRATKLSTTGGFLRSGNMTILVGVEEDKIDEVISIFAKTCSKRKKVMASPDIVSMGGMMANYPIEIEVGGATIFILDVDRFERL